MTSSVFGIGMTSLFSHLSHEAVTAVLPALLASMGVAAGVHGTIEGVADGLSIFICARGFFSDTAVRWTADQDSPCSEKIDQLPALPLFGGLMSAHTAAGAVA